ncbi:hypothetical protein PV08_09937 [Exophiala spinifera]|uniref:NmrA-like domain-containing protein n=1 Tax=Exophiala spinifera TaxID=91928 RepID=A0A0D2BNE8_9EURO|nr:uncharacterized protein PV08_09937 [Exophiala spinifera]KIW12659.1 hypothetical protein PV08_09937 [Exophiala spinifera]
MATYLVTGATGVQGGAVVSELLAAGATIHAVVRDPTSAKAAALREKGVVLFQGTHEEPDTAFRAAAAGCTGLFLNLSIFEPGKARAQADAVTKACKAGAGNSLTSIVLSSTSRTMEMSTQPSTTSAVHPWLGLYYTAKAEVEAAVRDSGIRDYTILRPPILNHDFFLPHSAHSHGFPHLPRSGTLVTSLDDNRTMPYLDGYDVGKFAVAALLNPTKFSGHEIDLASDNLSARDVCEILARVSGLDVKFHKRTPAEMEESKNTELFQVFEILTNRVGRRVDVQGLEQKYGIKTTTFEEYMERNKERLLGSLPPRSAAFLQSAS